MLNSCYLAFFDFSVNLTLQSTAGEIAIPVVVLIGNSRPLNDEATIDPARKPLTVERSINSRSRSLLNFHADTAATTITIIMTAIWLTIIIETSGVC